MGCHGWPRARRGWFELLGYCCTDIGHHNVNHLPSFALGNVRRKATLVDSRMHIHIDNLCVDAPGKRILSNVSLQVYGGELPDSLLPSQLESSTMGKIGEKA